MLYITVHFRIVFGTDSMISTKTGFRSDTDKIFQKQDRIGYQKTLSDNLWNA